MKLTSADHLQFITENLTAGRSFREIARALGCDQGTVSKFVRQHDLKYAPATKAPKGKITDPVDDAALIDAELKELRAAARKDRKLDVQAERLLAEVRSITPEAEPRYEAPDSAEGSGHEHAFVLLLSDLHCGEVVNVEAMNGLGEYSFEILQGRLAHITQSLISYQNNRPYPITELHILSLGDMIGGRHHQELAETNEFGPITQTWRTGMLLGKFVEGLVPHFPVIYYDSVDGNHSRLNEKHQSKQVFESFDWLAAKVSELYLRQYPSIIHNHPLAGMTLHRVAGKTLLLWHGDGVKSSMPGVPWGGLMRRFAQLKATYAQLGEYLDYLTVGHFHQANVVKGIFMNGSTIGPNEHALKEFGNADPWEQLLLTFDKDASRLTDVSYINES